MGIKVIIFFAVCLGFVSCNEVVPRKPVTFSKVSKLDKTVLLNKKLFAEEEWMLKKYMELDSTHAYINSKKGFWYTYINEEKDGDFPIKGDQVVFEQEISALDGSVLYKKNELGLVNYVVDKEYLIKGLKEGIKLMKEGEEVKFLFSSFVAYRMNGDTSKVIGSNQPIISTVKLIEIKNNNN